MLTQRLCRPAPARHQVGRDIGTRVRDGASCNDEAGGACRNVKPAPQHCDPRNQVQFQKLNGRLSGQLGDEHAGVVGKALNNSRCGSPDEPITTELNDPHLVQPATARTGRTRVGIHTEPPRNRMTVWVMPAGRHARREQHH